MTMTKTIYTDHKDLFSNKYSNWYYSIIENAQSKSRKRGNDYYENHHILPKSIFPEFTNENWNKVLLTAKEHFICHHLLTKFTKNNLKRKMDNAHHKMCFCISPDHKREYKISSSVYDNARKQHSENISGKNHPMYGIRGKENPLYGIPRSQETKDKISKANKGKMCGKEHPLYGTTWSDETRKKMKNRVYGSGENSTKFKGWYITPEGKFTTGDCLYPLVHKSALIKWCKNPDKIVTKRMITNSRYLQKINAQVGQTLREIGFGFEPT